MGDTSNWNYIRRSEYRAPGFATEAVHSLRGAWRSLRQKLAALGGKPAEPRGELERPAELPAGLVPEFDVEGAAAALTEHLREDLEGHPERTRLRVLIGPPGAHVSEILSAAARANGWTEIVAPDRQDLIDGLEALRKHFERLGESAKSPCVVNLERWFLRRACAMPAIRAAAAALGARSGVTLVGCDSWTWSYLDRAIGIEAALGEPLTLAPFDGARLIEWLGEPFRSSELVCMRAGTDTEIFPRSAGESDGDEARAAFKRSRGHLDQLASAARGNPGVALELWRRSLRSSDEGGGEGDLTDRESERSWWALAPAEAEIGPPATLDDLDRFVLHATLLHGGLALERLCEGLPFSEQEIVRRARVLRSTGILVERDEDLRVSEAAYGGIRRHLATRGFHVDDF